MRGFQPNAFQRGAFQMEGRGWIYISPANPPTPSPAPPDWTPNDPDADNWIYIPPKE